MKYGNKTLLKPSHQFNFKFSFLFPFSMYPVPRFPSPLSLWSPFPVLPFTHIWRVRCPPDLWQKSFNEIVAVYGKYHEYCY